MKVKVRFLSGLFLITKEKEAVFEFTGNTISIHDLILEFLKKYGDDFQKLIFRNIPKGEIDRFRKEEIELEIKELNFVLNNNILHYNKERNINDGETVVAFLPVAGG